MANERVAVNSQKFVPASGARVPSITQNGLHSPEQLPGAGTPAYMEPRLGHKFSQISIHPRPQPPLVDDVLHSSGHPLDPGTREFFENRFGHQFGNVRIHSDARAAESALAVNALAYTVGRNVVFGAGQYRQGTREGMRLLAHELTHVVQQSNPGSAGATSALESEAHAVSDHVLAGHTASIRGTASQGTLQRQEADDDGPGAIQVIAKENGRIAVVLTKNGKIIQGYAEIVPPPGVSAADAVKNGLVQAYDVSEAPKPTLKFGPGKKSLVTAYETKSARPKVTVVVPPEWSRRQPVNPAANVQVKEAKEYEREQQQIEVERLRKEKAHKVRELYRQFLADYNFQHEKFGTIITWESADTKSDDEILALQSDKFFFEWMQRRRSKREWQEFQREAQAMGHTDPEGIKEMWKQYRQPHLAAELTEEKQLHELKYETEQALQQNYAKPILLNWMASDPKPEKVTGDEGTVKMYVLWLPDGNFATLNEAQYLKLRRIAKDKIETDLNRIQNEKGGYEFHKKDRSLAGKALDVAAGAELEGKTWDDIDESVQAGRDALAEGDLKASLEHIEHAEKLGGVARKEWNRYLHHREVAGEVWIGGLETIKTGSEIFLAIGTAPLGGTGLIIVTGKGVAETVVLATAQEVGGQHVDWGDVGVDVGIQAVTGLATHGLGKLQALGPKNPIMMAFRESFGAQVGADVVQSVLLDSATYAARQAYQEARGRGEKFTSQDFINHVTKYLTDPTGLPLDVVKGQILRHAAKPVAKFAAKHGIDPGPHGRALIAQDAPAEQPTGQKPAVDEGAAANVERPVAKQEGKPDAPEAVKAAPQQRAGDAPVAEREVAGKKPAVPEPGQKPSITVNVSGSGPKGKPAAPGKSPRKAPPIPASSQSKESKGPAANEPAPAGSSAGVPAAEAQARPVVRELPESSVISNLSHKDAMTVYENSIKEDPHREVGIWENAATGERVVVQGDSATVDTTTVLYSDPEFAQSKWKMVEHFHPGEDVKARIPSAQDFDVITHWQREGAEPRGAVKSEVRYIDPVTKKAQTTEFGYDPDSPLPYYIEYTAADGSRQRRDFVDPPWAENSDFRRFSESYTGAPGEKVPAAAGVDIEPVTSRKPPVGPATPEASEAGSPERAPRMGAAGGELKPGSPPGETTSGGKPPPTPASPVGWRVVQVNPNQPPDTVPPNTIFEFPNGARVWRTRDGKIAQKSMLAPSVGRANAPGYEKGMYTQREAGLVGPKQERAHSQGQGTGFESPYGILYAPREVNQTLQNKGVEAYMRDLRDNAPPGFGFRFRTETAPQPKTMRLQEITYSVDIVDPDGISHPFFEFKINVGGTRTAPKVDIEPVEFADNEFAQQMKNLVDVPAVMETGLK